MENSRSITNELTIVRIMKVQQLKEFEGVNQCEIESSHECSYYTGQATASEREKPSFTPLLACSRSQVSIGSMPVECRLLRVGERLKTKFPV